jgi:DNA-binding response OmpR family regulator
MVIDDDVEIVHYVKTMLSPTYNVLGRFNVDSALESIREKAPDLILCDVMMQGKDGFELCQEVKNDLQLCHIPVILVTARTTTTDQIKGLGSGADAYVTKPFDPAYLQALINSIMQNRDKVRHILGSSTQTDTLETDTLSPQENAFMTELYKIMEAELSNSDLDVSHMTDMLRISRTKLYYKVKGLTGENPSAFFRRYKLNRAAELIKEGRYNMSEIADLTGFSSLSHFSTSFKKQFGTNPSEYK